MSRMHALPHPIRVSAGWAEVFGALEESGHGGTIERLIQMFRDNPNVPMRVLVGQQYDSDPVIRRLVDITQGAPGSDNAGSLIICLHAARHTKLDDPILKFSSSLLERLEKTDIDNKMPCHFLRTPYKRCYVQFETPIEWPYVVENSLTGRHRFEGAYLAYYSEDGPIGEHLEITLCGAPKAGAHYLDDCSVELAIALDDPKLSVSEAFEKTLETFREKLGGPTTMERLGFTDSVKDCLRPVAKALLFLNSASVRLDVVKDRSEMDAKLTRLKSAHKLRKTERLAAAVYDYVRVSSQSTEATGRGKMRAGSAVTAHWRRGHFRQQPYGPGATQRRLIWLEPTLVGSGEVKPKDYRVA